MTSGFPCDPVRRGHPVTGPLPARAAPQPLIGPGDPPPAEVLNPGGAAPMVLVCDHARRCIPKALGTLGLPEAELRRHIAYDIGAAAVTRHLSARFDAPAVLSGYSRLVIDPNRALDDPTAVPVVSDDVVVMRCGRIVESGPTDRVLDAPEHDYTKALLSAVPRRGWKPVRTRLPDSGSADLVPASAEAEAAGANNTAAAPSEPPPGSRPR